MRKKLNKKGVDKLISVYWFVILVIIAGGVVGMVNVFYNSPYDIREVEGNILSNKIADCVYSGGKLNPLFNSNGIFRDEFRDNFLDRCNLVFETGRELEIPQYYFSIEFLENGDKKKSKFFTEEGNNRRREDCFIDSSKDTLSKCIRNSFWVNGANNEAYLVNMLVVINKVNENAR
jgi:hypothetical protein